MLNMFEIFMFLLMLTKICSKQCFVVIDQSTKESLFVVIGMFDFQ